MNKKRFYIIASTLLLIGLSAGIVQYVGAFDALYAAAKNPGHTWSEMECTDDLCIDTVNHKVKIKNLQLDGMLYDTTGLPASDAAFLRTTEEGLRWDEPLTWTGSIFGIVDCANIGGTVFDTGTGTICRISGSTVPAGWRQAANWQRYSISSWGGDACGHHISSAPITWVNTLATCLTAGAYKSDNNGYCTGDTGSWHTSTSPYHNLFYTLNTPNCSTYRLEVGVY